MLFIKKTILVIFLSPFINIWNLILSFNSCRVLTNIKSWKYFPHFTDHGILVAPFYWVRIYNLMRHGRNGVSRTLGLGSHNMSAFWQYSILSAYLYWKAGAVTLLISMVIYTLSLFAWITVANLYHVLLCMAIIVSSEKFYSNFLYRQNYNVTGWALLPLVLYSIHTENIYIWAFAFILLPFLSITALFTSSIISIYFSIESNAFYTILFPTCSLIVFLVHVKGTADLKSFISSILNRLKMIGFYKSKKQKFVRKREYHHFDIIYILLQLQFVITAYIINTELHTPILICIALHLINNSCCRFADEQSFSILYLTCSAFCMLSSVNPTPFLYVSFYVSLFDPRYKSTPVSPINVKLILDRIDQFIQPVKSRQKILLAYSDPKGDYDKIFDGYRFLIDYVVYCSNLKGIHALPDFSTVYDINHSQSENPWGRDPSKVSMNMDTYQADYVIVYQDSNSKLDKKWEANGYICAGDLNWDKFLKTFPYYINPHIYKRPSWFLLTKS